MNFIVIQYELLFSKTNIFSSIIVFALFMLLFYPLIAVIIGRWDFQKGSFKVDATISLLYNPEWVKLNTKVDLIITKLITMEKEQH
jgi:hypothetical protein